MAIIPGTRVIQPIVPNDSNDVYPTHTDRYGHGGYRSVNDRIERDNIPIERQKLGMAVYVNSDQMLYILLTVSETLDDSCWMVFSSGGGGECVVVSPTQPTNPREGMLWLNSTNGKIYVYSQSQWEVFVYSSQMVDDNGELILNGGYF
jgi:hypothetical protein